MDAANKGMLAKVAIAVLLGLPATIVLFPLAALMSYGGAEGLVREATTLEWKELVGGVLLFAWSTAGVLGIVGFWSWTFAARWMSARSRRMTAFCVFLGVAAILPLALLADLLFGLFLGLGMAFGLLICRWLVRPGTMADPDGAAAQPSNKAGSPDAQAPARIAVNGLDHVRVLGRDLETTKDVFRALGFAVPPRGDNFGHPLGSWQTLTRFRDAFFLEFLSIKDPELAKTGRPEFLSFLARTEGGHSVVLNVPSAVHASQALRAAGLAATAPVAGSFMPGDDAGPMSDGWWLVNLEAAPMRREILSFIEYRHPWSAQVSYSAALPAQPNGVVGAHAVTIAVPDASAAVAHFARMGLGEARSTAAGLEISLGSGQCLLVVEQAGEAQVAGVSFTVESRAIEAIARGLGIDAKWGAGPFGESFVIPAEHAMGIRLEFVLA
jgi:catechol 2,3-dioxygenase-like lactoylglutathione lyase family enzyme